MNTADVLIIGGGIIGMSCAMQLARRSRARIVVLEKGAGPGEGSTGASSAVCRFKYSRPETVRLARDGIGAYRRWREFLDLPDPLAVYHNHGVLWLGAEGPSRDADRLGALGVRAAVLDDAHLRQRFPALNTCVLSPDVETGETHDCRGDGLHLLELDGGYMDPVDTLQDLIAAARRKDVEVRFQSKVALVNSSSGRVTGLTLADGAVLQGPVVINAAGPWCNEIFAAAGLACPWPLRPTRIQVALVERPPEAPGDIPVCVDLAGGIYFRTQNRGRQFVVGSVLEQDEREEITDPDTFANFADDDFIRRKLHVLQHRIPALQRMRGVRGYSGLYTMNRSDVHPVVGCTPLGGFLVANGFSGHGFKLAPAIGSLIAQELTGERGEFDTDVNAHFLAFDREPIAVATKSVLA
jgi:glycine/D-amino acid oxidase-like deaminating enzyme